MNKKIIAYLLIPFFVSLAGCLNGQSKTKKMFEEQLNAIKGTKSYQDVQKSANESINQWLAAGLEEVQVLKECNWKVDDAVFFNTKKDRAYLLLLLQDKDKDAELDYVYVMYGALENEKWTIYFVSLPNLVFPRERLSGDKHQPVPLAELSRLARQEILKGYYKGAAINDEYVEKVYTEDLRNRQARFLNQKH
ncbi:hypothetical protein HDF26_003128 [Pedobacter cryoconitis]|uniref:hypothetical protein n=1 Tax=Pedobacter cryoconitis TaxID=188932 RepID=UPI00161B37AA|nr:hypothetical protein [Pedobacter cryoconitis]MBB6272671.1 hypothetical protein [Pedobacter cryoconitis]